MFKSFLKIVLRNLRKHHYYFMDDSFNDTYKAELRLGNIFITFTILSIVIAGLGLLGLAIFNAEKRTKEIGVRKVLGATVANVVTLLAFRFTHYELRIRSLPCSKTISKSCCGIC